jgi:mono/diheme cytochrome c family protein
MMRGILKWAGRIFAAGIALVILAALGFAIAGTIRLNKKHEIEVSPLNIPTDGTALARGEHLVDVFCAGCHGTDLIGHPVVDDPTLGVISSSNITGAADRFTDEQLLLSIRHGLDADGRYLMIMPVDSHIFFSKEDLGAIIAFLKTVPQSGALHETRQLKPLVRILVGMGAMDMIFPGMSIDHGLPFPDMVEVGANRPYGEYLARHCRGCHGPDLAGGTPPDPASPPAPNLTQAGELNTWTEEGFITTLRTGVTPNGHELQEGMPWESYAKLDDGELQGLWLYLSSLDPPAVSESE